MGKWSFSCRINLDQAAYFKELLADFSVRSIANGYLAEIEIDEEHPSDDGYADAVVTLFHRCAKERGEERQVFLHRQVLIQRELTRHIAHALPHLPHLLHHIESVHCRRPRFRQQQ